MAKARGAGDIHAPEEAVSVTRRAEAPRTSDRPRRSAVQARAPEYRDPAEHGSAATAPSCNADRIDGSSGPQNPMRYDPSHGAFVGANPTLFQCFLPEVAHRTTGEILLHPDFARIRRRYVLDTTEHFATAIFPGGLQSTAYRVVALGVLMDLYEAWDPLDRETLPTLTRLKRKVAIINLSSPRQIDDFVHRLIQTKDVTLERTEIDGRIRLIKPSDRLASWHEAMTASYYGILDRLYPTPGYGLAVARDAEVLRAQRIVAKSTFAAIGRFLMQNEDLLPFLNMNLGGIVLMRLAVADEAAPDEAETDTLFDTLKLKYGITRSHFRNITVTAEERGLLERSGRRGKILSLTSRGHLAVDRFIADTLASHDMTFRMALTKIGADGEGCRSLVRDIGSRALPAARGRDPSRAP